MGEQESLFGDGELESILAALGRPSETKGGGRRASRRVVELPPEPDSVLNVPPSKSLEGRNVLLMGCQPELVQSFATKFKLDGIDNFEIAEDPDNEGCYLFYIPPLYSVLLLDGDIEQCPSCKIGKIVCHGKKNDWICPTCGYSDVFRRRLALKEFELYMAKDTPLKDNNGQEVRLPLFFLTAVDFQKLNANKIEHLIATDWYTVEGESGYILVPIRESCIPNFEAIDLTEFGIDIFEKWQLNRIPVNKHKFSSNDGFYVEGEFVPAEDEEEPQTDEVVPHEVISSGKPLDKKAMEDLFDMVVRNVENSEQSTNDSTQ